MTDVVVGWGWGRDSWGEGAWGTDEFPGLLVGELGTVAVIAGTGVTVPLTGVSALGEIGTVTVTFPVTVFVTGVGAVGVVNIAGVIGDAVVYPFGVEGVGQIGSPLVWGQIDDGQLPDWQPIDTPQTDIWTPIPAIDADIWTRVLT